MAKGRVHRHLRWMQAARLFDLLFAAFGGRLNNRKPDVQCALDPSGSGRANLSDAT